MVFPLPIAADPSLCGKSLEVSLHHALKSAAGRQRRGRAWEEDPMGVLRGLLIVAMTLSMAVSLVSAAFGATWA